MLLRINSEYQIAGTRNAWELQKSRKKKGKTIWESFQYYSSLDGAINGLVELRLRTCEAQNLTEALKEVENFVTELCRALPPQFVVCQRDKAA